MTPDLDRAALADFARRQVPESLFVTVSGAHLYGFPSAVAQNAQLADIAQH